MDITNQVTSIFEHPYFKQSIRKYNNGDDKDLRHVIRESIIHTYLTVAMNCGRAFKMNKWANHPEIYAAIKDITPPTNLDLRLPIPPIIEEDKCIVVPLKVKAKTYKFKIIANQLELPFLPKAPRILQEA